MSKKPNVSLDDIIDNLTHNLMKNKKKSPSRHSSESSDKQKNKNTRDSPIPKHNSDEPEDDFIEGINYYKIIGVSPQDTQEQINRKCNEKLKAFHPDKIMCKLERCTKAEQTALKKKYDLQYQLVRDAIKILKNPEKRKYYDLQKKNKNTNYKKEFEKFRKLENIENDGETQKTRELEFREKSKELDKKHKYDSSKQDYKLGNNDITQRINDLQFERRQQETEYSQKNMFSHGNFDSTQFNKKFEAMKKIKDNHKKSTNDNKTIIKWDGLAAFGDLGTTGDNYVAIKEDGSGYDDGQDTKDTILPYASHIESDEESISSDEEIEEDPIRIENKKTVEELHKQMMSKRTEDETSFKNTTVNEWGNMDKNPFNVFNQIKGIISETDLHNNMKGPDVEEAIRELTYKK